MKPINMTKLFAAITLVLSQSASVNHAAADDFAPGEWCPATRTVYNSETQNMVPLVLSKCTVTIGYYVPDDMVTDPDDKLCVETEGEKCILENPEPQPDPYGKPKSRSKP